MDSLKAFGRAFGKPSSLFIASWPLVLRRPVELAPQLRTYRCSALNVAKGPVWTVPALQEESDFSAKRSGAAMYTACFRLEDYLGGDAATVAAGPDVIR
jgi:hypothetical protein